MTAALATQWILDGSAAGLMEGVRKEARLRHRMARDILAGRYSGAGDRGEGIAVMPAEASATGSGSMNAVRISPGTIKDRGRLQAGLQRLSDLLARRPAGLAEAT